MDVGCFFQLRGRLQKVMLTIVVIGGCIGFDQATKVMAKDYLASIGPLSYAGDLFRFYYTENRGAFLSLGALLPEGMRFWVFTILAGLVLSGIFIFVILSDERRLLPVVAYTLVVGGGLSNLIDRVLNDGAVVDFMNVGLGGLRTGIFNVADMAITAGVVLLMLVGFRHGPADGQSGEGLSEADDPVEMGASEEGGPRVE